MATRSMIYKEEQDGTLKGIYCHWDGSLEYNGSILLEHYSDPEKLERLLALGDISSLGADIKGVKDGSETIAYHRDYGEELEPNDIITLEEQKQGEHLFEKGIDYIYIQDKNGVWYVNLKDGDKCFNGVPFKKVTQEMVEG